MDRFIDSSDFFTVDVASYIGMKADESEIEKFLSGAMKFTGDLKLPAINKSLTVTKSHLGNSPEISVCNKESRRVI